MQFTTKCVAVIFVQRSRYQQFIPTKCPSPKGLSWVAHNTKKRTDAFLEVASFLEENDDEQVTINDLVSRMEDNLANSENGAYSYQYMQLKLHEHFGDSIIQTEINGKSNVVTFRNKAKAVLHEFYSHQKADPETEKLRIVQTAAKLIRDDIKAVETSHRVYPACIELESDECIKLPYQKP